MNVSARSLLFDPANLMSLVRIPFAALVWLRPHDPWFLGVLVVAAALSDMVDGRLGRRTHAGLTGTANIGAWLDPVCDKIFIISATTAVVVAYEMPLAILALVLVRDVALAVLTIVFRVSGGRDAFHSHDFRARPTGKITTVAQTATILAVIVAPNLVLPLAVASAFLGVIAVGERLVLARAHVSTHAPEAQHMHQRRAALSPSEKTT